MDMSNTRIQVGHSPPFARIALVNGKQNVLDFAMMDELPQPAVKQGELDPTQVVVFSVWRK